MTLAEIPDALWSALRSFQVVLRESANALACSSSVMRPALLSAIRNSLILLDCRALASAMPTVAACGNPGSAKYMISRSKCSFDSR